MRKIKFRFYSEVHNKIIPWSEINKNHLHHYLSGKIDNVKSMQFTGLVDKNKKEIYEGDIIRGETRKFEVIFYAGMFTTDVGQYLLNGEYEIIGNIYENPELLDVSEV